MHGNVTAPSTYATNTVAAPPQALEAIPRLEEKFPIKRAMMRLDVSLPLANRQARALLHDSAPCQCRHACACAVHEGAKVG